ncbi:hypothetical protein Cgig2_012748 [Carnegiea gigantea]|uniref:Neprosin PEP catalytic domain-containing protein n=1 Tax=Carnegiea gigantea TaxID=171969 RepID=A0A9Q1KCG6_9CARY|nr:hypothetical protein Cgig2_012748 [Carnegiea gigantea]
MAPSSYSSSSIISKFVVFLLVVFMLSPALSISRNQTLEPQKELQKLRRIRAHLRKINKPTSPDGDVIDCVPTHLQPAFDHPQLKGQRPLHPPERPKGSDPADEVLESLQLWTESGESCPEGTIPIRRTTEDDVLRASKAGRFGKKSIRIARRDSTGNGHEKKRFIRKISKGSRKLFLQLKMPCIDQLFITLHVLNAIAIHAYIESNGLMANAMSNTFSGLQHAVAYVNGDQFYGAKASMNVWTPHVTDAYEFSLSQIWVISGSFGNDLNTIEAGWQAKFRPHFGTIRTGLHVNPALYGDQNPRFFTYWTTDAYQTTGCYNLLCSGFVQTTTKIAIGAAISPKSTFRGRQYDISLTVWKASLPLPSQQPNLQSRKFSCIKYSEVKQNRKRNNFWTLGFKDPKHGHWWLEFGSGLLVGYWPAFLFSHLRSYANMIQFGGEIVNSRSHGFHTSTQMGSGHFAEEGFGRAAYFRNLQGVDWDNNLVPLSNIHLLADHPNCYDIRQGKNNVWGNYFYYGGPGRNVKCP